MADAFTVHKNITAITSKFDGLLILIQAIFIGLKLFGTFDWSWWWVMSPTLWLVGFAIFLPIACRIIFSSKEEGNDQGIQ